MRLADYRQRIGLSLGALARSTGVARATLRRIEEGGGCSASSAFRIIRATHGLVELEDLIPQQPEDPAVAE